MSCNQNSIIGLNIAEYGAKIPQAKQVEHFIKDIDANGTITTSMSKFDTKYRVKDPMFEVAQSQARNQTYPPYEALTNARDAGDIESGRRNSNHCNT